MIKNSFILESYWNISKHQERSATLARNFGALHDFYIPHTQIYQRTISQKTPGTYSDRTRCGSGNILPKF